MKSEKDKIKNIFSLKLDSFEPELPPSLWGRIEGDLSSAELISGSSSKRSVVYKTLAWLAGAAAIVFAVLFFQNKSLEVDEAILVQSRTDSAILSSPKQVLHQGLSSLKDTKKDSVVLVSKVLHKSFIASGNLANKDEVQVDYSSLQKNEKVVGVSEYKDTAGNSVLMLTDLENACIGVLNVKSTDVKDSVIKKQSSADLAEKILAFESQGEKNATLLAFVTPKSTSKKIEVGFGGSTGFSKSNDTQNQLRYSSVFSSTPELRKSGGYTRQTVKLEHHQPLSFGFALNKRISNKISLETGLIYTYLYSRVKSVPGSSYKLRDSQSFHYLGIPLSLNYKMGEWKKIQFYLSGGGVVQKDFYGRMDTYQTLQSLSNSKELIEKNISQSHPQFSLTGSLGLSYPIYNRFSVYGNFGGAYYFDAKNYYETIYSDRKLIFNLNVGIKFEL